MGRAKKQAFAESDFGKKVLGQKLATQDEEEPKEVKRAQPKPKKETRRAETQMPAVKRVSRSPAGPKPAGPTRPALGVRSTAKPWTHTDA